MKMFVQGPKQCTCPCGEHQNGKLTLRFYTMKTPLKFKEQCNLKCLLITYHNIMDDKKVWDTLTWLQSVKGNYLNLL